MNKRICSPESSEKADFWRWIGLFSHRRFADHATCESCKRGGEVGDKVKQRIMHKRTDASEFWGHGGTVALLMALFFVFAALMGRDVVHAQTATATPIQETQAEGAQAVAPSGVAQNGVTPDEVNSVARELWCPLCNGVRLDACELKACEQMRDVIAVKLAEGEDSESIKAYFVEQYGPQVMGEPPRQGFNWLAWILPAVAAVVGGYFFWRTTQRMVQPQPSPATLGANPAIDSATNPAINPDTDLGTMPGSPATQASTVAGAAASDAAGRHSGEEDEYMQKLDEELAKYG
jgi:cytochrome c-type biogenesis protein CcmH